LIKAIPGDAPIMKICLFLFLAMVSTVARAACEDMEIWARVLQPFSNCVSRTEYDRRVQMNDQAMEAEAAKNEGIRRAASLELTRAALAQTYGVSLDAVSVQAQRTENGFGVYYINNAEFVCQNTIWGFGCIDNAGRPGKSLSAAQLKYIYDHSWEARIDENGQLVASRSVKAAHKKR
jgi:hypothetical protein